VVERAERVTRLAREEKEGKEEAREEGREEGSGASAGLLSEVGAR